MTNFDALLAQAERIRTKWADAHQKFRRIYPAGRVMVGADSHARPNTWADLPSHGGHSCKGAMRGMAPLQ